MGSQLWQQRYCDWTVNGVYERREVWWETRATQGGVQLTVHVPREPRAPFHWIAKHVGVLCRESPRGSATTLYGAMRAAEAGAQRIPNEKRGWWTPHRRRPRLNRKTRRIHLQPVLSRPELAPEAGDIPF